MDWDDARVFLAVARHGSLRAAGRALGLSQPTIGRRLAGFEKSLGGPALFDRLPDGLRPTAAGAAMISAAEQLEQAALALERRGAAAAAALSGTVRVSVGVWGVGFLVRHLAGNVLPSGLLLELIESPDTANLARRDADLAVRHRMPEAGNLYAARLGVIAAAVYRRRGSHCALEGAPWITYPEELSYKDNARWIERQARAGGGRVALRASSLEMWFDAVRAGVGIALLPCYSADADPALERLTPPIAEQGAEYWVSVHRDLRRTPRVRTVIDWVRQLFRDQPAALAGLDARAPAVAAGW